MLMFFVRPHIAIFMLLAYATTYIITSREVKNSIIVKIIILFLIAILGLLSLPYILSYLGISELSIDKIISFIDFRSKVDMGGGSSYDNSGPLIWNAFSFFFRPLFFDARSLFQFVYSFENAIILIILFKYIFLQLHKIIINIKSKIVIYILSYSFSLGLIMVYITSNLGLAVRQKYMILPFLFVLSAIVARHLFIKKNKGSQQLRHV